MVYQIVTISGRIIEFESDTCITEDGMIYFLSGGEEVGAFKVDNIAGYIVEETE